MLALQSIRMNEHVQVNKSWLCTVYLLVMLRLVSTDGSCAWFQPWSFSCWNPSEHPHRSCCCTSVMVPEKPFGSETVDAKYPLSWIVDAQFGLNEGLPHNSWPLCPSGVFGSTSLALRTLLRNFLFVCHKPCCGHQLFYSSLIQMSCSRRMMWKPFILQVCKYCLQTDVQKLWAVWCKSLASFPSCFIPNQCAHHQHDNKNNTFLQLG